MAEVSLSRYVYPRDAKSMEPRLTKSLEWIKQTESVTRIHDFQIQATILNLLKYIFLIFLDDKHKYLIKI